MSEILTNINDIISRLTKNNSILNQNMNLTDIDGLNSLTIVLLFVELEKLYKIEFPLDFEPNSIIDLIEFIYSEI